MEDNKLIYECQYGFRKGSGTENAVTNDVNYIFNGLKLGFKGVAGIFYDFSKAFKLLDHEILIQELQFYGIRGRELNLFKN